MDISVLADGEATVDSSLPFVFNPWKMKDLRRLYVNLPDGTKIGYLDLATLAAVPEDGGTQEQLTHALSHLGAIAPALAVIPGPDTAPSAEVFYPEAARVVGAPRSPLPWSDLAFNIPGRSIADQEDASYKAGVAGEQRTAGALAVLERQGYRILHSIPLSPRKDIDHLVIGPTGLFAINTKATTYEVTAKSDGAVYTDGYRQSWVDSITRDSGIAAGYLANAARMELDVRPLVAVWSTIRVNSASAVLAAGDDVARHITGGEHLYQEAWVDVVFNVARRSDSWTANH